MRVSLSFLGCKVNQAEIAQIEQALVANGHEIVPLDQSPDVCLVNTCTVTARSDVQSRQLIRRASETGGKVFVTGCYSSINPESASLGNPYIKLIPNLDKDSIISLIAPDSKSIVLDNKVSFRTRYFLKAQDGCDFKCTYCIVWQARGKSRSVPLEEVLRRAQEAYDAGFAEVVLTGIHLGLYGRDLDQSVSLHDLVERLLIKTSVKRIRLSSLELNEVDERLVDLMKDRRICPHLHIPLQSCSDNVLKAMGRLYGRDDIIHKIKWISNACGPIGLGADIIAGFPSETEVDFNETMDVLRGLPLTYMHVFPYSSRPGTPASSMNDIAAPFRKDRAEALRKLSASMKTAYQLSQIGSPLEVLIEKDLGNGRWEGTSGNYLRVAISSPVNPKGHVLTITATGIDNGTLISTV